jgi:hypothetical protein
MRIRAVIEIEVERESGPFRSKDALGEEVQQALESADYGSWDLEGSMYNTVDWSVTVET